MDVPAMSARGLPGRRVEPYRAGMTMTIRVALIRKFALVVVLNSLLFGRHAQNIALQPVGTCSNPVRAMLSQANLSEAVHAVKFFSKTSAFSTHSHL
jgi:hypothetical protein